AILLDRDLATFSGTTQITAPRETAALIDQLRDADTTLTYDPDTRTLRTGDSSIAAVTVGPDRLHRNNSTRKEEANPPKAPAVAEGRAWVTLTHARKQALMGS
ncbi:MAG TPA: hypothetical protein VGD83_14335, partial [Streptosporangiaceae bacterium]